MFKLDDLNIYGMCIYRHVYRHVYIYCNVQRGHIFRGTVKLMNLTAKRAAGVKRPLITKLPTTLENPINVIKGSVREIRKDGPGE